MDRETVREMIPAYALGVLDAEEKRQVEALLAEDESARKLLAEYQVVVEAVALTTPASQPPADLERKLLQRARQTRSLRRVDFRPLAVAAAVMVLLFAAVVLVSRLSSPPDVQQVYAQIMADPQATQIALVPDLSPDIEGQLVFRQGETTAVIRVSNLPPLEADQAYQLWLVDEAGPVSGGVYRLTGQTNYIQVPLEKPVLEYNRFGVSLEPESGSPLGNKPSGPRVFNIPIQSS